MYGCGWIHYDQPLGIVFENVYVDENDAVDLAIHWITVGRSGEMVGPPDEEG